MLRLEENTTQSAKSYKLKQIWDPDPTAQNNSACGTQRNFTLSGQSAPLIGSTTPRADRDTERYTWYTQSQLTDSVYHVYLSAHSVYHVSCDDTVTLAARMHIVAACCHIGHIV